MARKGLIFLLGGLLLGSLLGALILFSNSPIKAAAIVGSSVNDLEFLGLQNRTIKLSQFQGTPVVLNFWATWCVPCQEEMPLLQQYSDEYKGKIVVVGVNSQETESIVTTYINRKNITFQIALDPSGEMIRRFVIQGYPTTYFLDANGVVRAEHIGQLRDDLMQGYLSTIGVKP